MCGFEIDPACVLQEALKDFVRGKDFTRRLVKVDHQTDIKMCFKCKVLFFFFFFSGSRNIIYLLELFFLAKSM